MYFLRAIFRFLFIACIQIVRSKMTSLDAIFCSGNKSSSRSLARFCRRKQKKIYRSRFALVHENYATVKINPWEKFQNLRGFECKTTQPWLGGKSCFFLYKSFKSFGGRCNRCFLDIRLKCYRLPSFNTRFQIPLLILFRSSLQKVYHMTNYCEGLLN